MLCFGQENKRVPSFSLQTQFDKEIKLSFPLAKPLVLAFANRESTDQLNIWTDKLRLDFGDSLEIVGVAVLENYGFMSEPFIKTYLKSKPEVLLDWGGELAQQFDYSPHNCLLVWIDTDGIILTSVRGEFRADQYGSFIHRIDSL